MRVLVGAAVLFLPFGVIGYLLCLLLGTAGWLRLPLIVVFASACSVAAVRFGLGVGNVSGQVVARFIAPSGRTTPYQYGYSYQQALAARGDVAGALESYEAVLNASPHDVEAHVQTAELYATSGNPSRAIEVFRALRGIPVVSDARDIYASNRLVDLHLAANDQGRALVELRRLIERYPGSDTATRAREALGTIKARHTSAE